MKTREAIEKEIREHWFKDHKAELKYLGEIQVLNWKRPGTIVYRVRYVFDGNMMYISGDLGEAVFWLTWKGHVHSFNDVHIQYFAEKLQAYNGDRWNFCSEKAVKRLREWLKDIKEYGRDYDHEEMRELFEEARSCGRVQEWTAIVNIRAKFISKLDCDFWEWFYDIGNEYPARLQSYLIGLKMASAQLKAAEGTPPEGVEI